MHIGELMRGGVRLMRVPALLRTFCLVYLCMLMMATWDVGCAQDVQTGHYIPGFAGGLKAGIMATEPGIYMSSTTHFFHASEFKDGSGNTVPNAGEIDYILTEIALVGRPKFKLFGGDYQAVLTLDFGNLSSRPVLVNGQPQDPPVGLSDIFFSPLTLGWHWTDFHLVASLSGFAPTGRFSLGDPDNTGTGFWTFMPYVAGTYRLARGIFAQVPLLVTGIVRYEVHSNQEGRDFRPGDTFTFEWGLGVELPTRTDIGVVGFLYRQVTDPSGADATPVDKYRSNGIGATITQGIGPVDVTLRAYWDFAVRNGPDGTAVFLDIGWKF